MWHYWDPLRTFTLSPSPEDWLRRFLTPSREILRSCPFINKFKEKTKVSFQVSGPFAEHLHAPLLGISKIHKEDNIQAIVSTPRPSLVLEEKEARDQFLDPDPAWCKRKRRPETNLGGPWNSTKCSTKRRISSQSRKKEQPPRNRGVFLQLWKSLPLIFLFAALRSRNW